MQVRPALRAAILLSLVAWSRPARADDDLGFRIPDGFKATVHADESLANDTYAMTLDARGRAVVTTRGQVKTLHDDDGDGRADRFTVYAEPETGAMGLCFDGNDLLVAADGWLSRYRDQDGDGKADGPPERLFPMAFTEHGGHAMRKGPDGWWYVIGGNDSLFNSKHATLPTSPIKTPEAGCLLRISPDGRQSEILAQGFRNPYDFDFDPLGQMFTYDSDVERDIFLPWYAPTRLYHVAVGGHHGWRVTGFMRSWPRPGYDPGTVDILDPIGRGSPTGVACYRHTQFPERYRGGLFVLDWTFGKIYFVAVEPHGGGYRSKVGVFIEPTGTSGFAPTDAAVAPDGTLLISIGGRRTRGSVYRIAHVGGTTKKAEPTDDLARVLDAPQPLDAWSRAIWQPLVEKLGRSPFEAVVRDDSASDARRIRAIEVLTELFGGLDPRSAEASAASRSSQVRARAAWSLGRLRKDQDNALPARLAADPDPAVRREALEALRKYRAAGSSEKNATALASNLGHPDKRVRLAAVGLALSLGEDAWTSAYRSMKEPNVRTRLGAELVALQRDPARQNALQPAIAGRLCSILGEAASVEDRLDAVRLLHRSLGDYHLVNPPIEVETGYSPQGSLDGHADLARRVARAVHAVFPSGDATLDDEAARLLAMVEDDDPSTPATLERYWTPSSGPSRDLHYLIVLSRLRGPWSPNLAGSVARTIVGLDGKLKGQEQRIKQSWNDRLGELVAKLLKSDERLADALLHQEGFITPGHVAIALALPAPQRAQAAGRYLALVRDEAEAAWSGPLIELLSSLPGQEYRPVFREQWANLALRDAILPKLADAPEEADRTRFLDALQSSQPPVVAAALRALGELPARGAADDLVPPLKLLRRLLLEPKEKATRERVVALLERETGRAFPIREDASTPAKLRASYAPVFDWFTESHPSEASKLSDGAEGLASLMQRVGKVDWTQGRAERGAKLFQERGCSTCHAGSRALGPDLTGATSRLSREDLFTAIAAPNLDVSPLYRTTIVETTQGFVVTGMVAFESADGLILQTGATTTTRIPSTDIASRHVGTQSLMPEQLLQSLADPDLADLDAYLRTLTPGRSAAR